MARLTSKGQITLPVEVRRKFDLVAGDDVLFAFRGTEVRLIPIKRRKLTELYGALPATRPFIGRDAIRKEVGRKLGQRLASEGGRR